jgi:NAD(P)-dependent dehydrogenase (short-subunit alcohol dehydrogenase family)
MPISEPKVDLSINPFDLTGKRVIVTGASRGIGRAIALAFAARGASVFAVARSAEDLNETVRLAAEHPGSIMAWTVDLTSPDVAPLLIEAAATALGGIDILVNNAGLDIEHAIEEHTLDEWNAVFDVNVRSVFLLCKAAEGHLKDGGGKVVNVASMLGHIASRANLGYISSKHALVGFTRALAVDWALEDVQVNAIGPGFVETDMLASATSDEATRAYIRRVIPQGRWAQPEEMTGAAIFLASDASDYVTGQTIIVDGGFSIQ